jgi:hypothetical protein
MIKYRSLNLSIVFFQDIIRLKVFNGIKTERFAEPKKDAYLIQHPAWAWQSTLRRFMRTWEKGNIDG